MTIDISKESSLVKFSELKSGDVFHYLDCVFLKVYDPNNGVNTIALNEGTCKCCYLGKDTLVYKAQSANLSVKF